MITLFTLMKMKNELLSKCCVFKDRQYIHMFICRVLAYHVMYDLREIKCLFCSVLIKQNTRFVPTPDFLIQYPCISQPHEDKARFRDSLIRMHLVRSIALPTVLAGMGILLSLFTSSKKTSLLISTYLLSRPSQRHKEKEKATRAASPVPDLEILLEVDLNFQVRHNNTGLWYFFPSEI